MASNWAGYRRLVAIIVGALALLAWVAPPASAADRLTRYDVSATIDADGSLAVRATMTFDAEPPASVRQEFATTSRTADRTEYRFTVSDVVATSDGQGKLINGVPASAAIHCCGRGCAHCRIYWRKSDV